MRNLSTELNRDEACIEKCNELQCHLSQARVVILKAKSAVHQTSRGKQFRCKEQQENSEAAWNH